MKHIKKIILVTSVFALISCKKDPEPKPVIEEKTIEQQHTFVVTGQLLDSCGGNPISGKVLAFWGDFLNKPSSFGQTTPAIFLQIDTTDQNGMFTFETSSLEKTYPYSIRFKDTSQSIATDIFIANGELTIEYDEQKVDIGRCYLFGFKKQANITLDNISLFFGARIVLSSTNTVSKFSDTLYPPAEEAVYSFTQNIVYSVTDMNKVGDYMAYYQINWGNSGLFSDISTVLLRSEEECGSRSESYFVKRK